MRNVQYLNERNWFYRASPLLNFPFQLKLKLFLKVASILISQDKDTLKSEIYFN